MWSRSRRLFYHVEERFAPAHDRGQATKVLIIGGDFSGKGSSSTGLPLIEGVSLFRCCGSKACCVLTSPGQHSSCLRACNREMRWADLCFVHVANAVAESSLLSQVNKLECMFTPPQVHHPACAKHASQEGQRGKNTNCLQVGSLPLP